MVKFCDDSRRNHLSKVDAERCQKGGGCINGRAIKVHDLSGLEKQLEGKMKVGIHHDSKMN